MSLDRALALFSELYLSDITDLDKLPERLAGAGFVECVRRSSQDAGDPHIDRVVHHDGRSDYAFSYLASGFWTISDGALLVPESAAAREALLAFVMALPNLAETTEETRVYMAFAPDRVTGSLMESRFWTSKDRGETGLNVSLGPALIGVPGAGACLALTVSANPHLGDALDAAELAALTGPGSRLAKFTTIFSEIARKACPDYAKIIWAADAYGYRGDVADGARSFLLSGGHGPNPRSEDMTSAIHITRDTEAAFEFALSFILDERLTGDTIRAALFDALNLPAQAHHGDKAVLELADGHYVVSHLCESAIFGNHIFLLQK